MTHYADSSAFGMLECLNGQFGTAVNIPTNFFKSGIANIYECYIGSASGIDAAALTIGPNPTNPITLDGKGFVNFEGLTTQKGGFVVNGYVNVKGGAYKCTSTAASFTCQTIALTSSNTSTLTSAKENKFVSPRTTIDSATTNISGICNLAGVGNLAVAINSKKGFDIPHPNKPNHRLRHICVEGPESAIYIRGKLVGSNVIELPDYWGGLIDPETITVNLTQIGHSQDLIVEKIEWGRKIIVKSGNGTSINCYYQVWADRLGEKLIVEYEGETPNDYPGDNSEYSIAGWDYDKRI